MNLNKIIMTSLLILLYNYIIQYYELDSIHRGR